MSKPRARDLGLDLPGVPGPFNAITDVPGVEVGYRTLIEGEGPLVPGAGPVRTGVTAILPRGRTPELMPVWAGVHALNGNGEMTGTHWIRHAGHFYGPVMITNTHSVGMAHHAAVRWTIDSYAHCFGPDHVWAMPVVAETYDGALNDINGQHVTAAHALQAIAAACGGPVAEGNVGGGTGMICYEFKGGTGTASRRLEVAGRAHTVAALVQANHGRRDWFTVMGVPVGRELPGERIYSRETGSIIVVLATDIPMLPHQLARVAERAGLGIARQGTPGGNSSGDIFLAFSVANPRTYLEFSQGRQSLEFVADELFDPIYMAAIEATEEAVLNAMLAAEDMATLKPPGLTCRALDGAALLDVLGRHRR